MKKYSKETAVGGFVLAALICIAYLTIHLGDLSLFGDGDTYRVKARFNSVQGLSVGSPVNIAGVNVGSVESITLDYEEFVAYVEMSLPNKLKLDDDTIVSIKSNGLIGDKFIGLSPGGSGFPVEPGDTLIETESAVDIEGLIRKFAFGNVEE